MCYVSARNEMDKDMGWIWIVLKLCSWRMKVSQRKNIKIDSMKKGSFFRTSQKSQWQCRFCSRAPSSIFPFIPFSSAVNNNRPEYFGKHTFYRYLMVFPPLSSHYIRYIAWFVLLFITWKRNQFARIDCADSHHFKVIHEPRDREDTTFTDDKMTFNRFNLTEFSGF